MSVIHIMVSNPKPKTCPCPNPGISGYVTIHSKKNFADIFKLKILRWIDYHKLSCRPNVIKRILLSAKAWQENQSHKKDDDGSRVERDSTAEFDDGRESQA